MAHSQSFSESDAVRSQGTARRFNNSQSLNEPNRIAVRQQHGRLPAVREDPDIPDFPQRSALVVEEEPDYVQPSLPGSGLRMGRRSLNNFPAPVMASSDALQGHLDDDHLTDISSAVRTSPPSYRPIASVSGSVRRPMGRNYAQNIPSAVVEESNFDGEMSTLARTSSAGPRRSYKRMPASEGGKSSSR
jgi:hypothetical protein